MLRGYRDGSRNFFSCIVVYIQWLPRVLLIFECLSFGLKEFTANFRLFNFNIVLAHRCLSILQQDLLLFVFTLCISNDNFFYLGLFVDNLVANRVYRHKLCLITELFSQQNFKLSIVKLRISRGCNRHANFRQGTSWCSRCKRCFRVAVTLF